MVMLRAVEKEYTLAELAQGVPLATGKHHRITVRANAVVQVAYASGAPATNESVIVRRSDGIEVVKRTNRFGRVFLYDMDPNAQFDVRLTRHAKELGGG